MITRYYIWFFSPVLFACLWSHNLTADDNAKTALLRIPNHGIQPQVVQDGKGNVHLIYFKGDSAGGDIFYVRAAAGSDKFSAPMQVNDQRGSAVAVGNIRGAHLALGKNGRVHVAWNGSQKAKLKDPANATGMFYARLNDAGTAFEPQRNMIQSAFGLDGGGSVAADVAGNVYVTWHAPIPGSKGESNRCVWVASSSDEGKTFAKEKKANPDATGACGCCGMRAFADSKGNLFFMYRTALESIHRDVHLLTSSAKESGFRNLKLHPWNIDACPMSSMSFVESSGTVFGAWDTEGQVFFARIDPATGSVSDPIPAPGHGKGRKHPVLAGNAKGETILAWTEGMGWNRGGSLAWQVFDKAGKLTTERGSAPGVPTWSLVAVFVRPDGGFSIVY